MGQGQEKPAEGVVERRVLFVVIDGTVRPNMVAELLASLSILRRATESFFFCIFAHTILNKATTTTATTTAPRLP